MTAVIPTRDRTDDLCAAVRSILSQTRRPDELVVVDQTVGDVPRRQVESLFAGHPGPAPRLVYIHDPRVRGLVDAKRVAAGASTGDVVCFLEDDVVLEAEYLEEIERSFLERPDMLGCCGVVTNLPPLPPYYCGLFHFFHRGIFLDPRVGVHGHTEGRGHPLIPSRALSGGLSAWKREVFAAIPFDVENEFHMLEDLDFSTRAEERFGARFFINPNARLAHNMSPVNRDRLGARQRRKIREFLTFFKKRRHLPWALASLGWLLPGLLAEAAFQSLAARTATPLAGFLAGLADGVRRPLREPPR